MRISRGFISNSSTYSYLTYVNKNTIDEVVIGTAEELFAKYGGDDALEYLVEESFYPLRVKDFGNTIQSRKEFISFLKNELRLNFPETIVGEKSPDNYSVDSKENTDVTKAISHLKEYDEMVRNGYVPIYVIQSSEDDDLTSYLCYIGDVPFPTKGGFTVIG